MLYGMTSILIWIYHLMAQDLEGFTELRTQAYIGVDSDLPAFFRRTQKEIPRSKAKGQLALTGTIWTVLHDVLNAFLSILESLCGSLGMHLGGKREAKKEAKKVTKKTLGRNLQGASAGDA